MEVYKIRRKTDGLYSVGGSHPSFSKNGKIWKQRNHLSSHMNLLTQQWGVGKHIYDNCELVTYEVVEKEVDSISLLDYLQEREELREAREEAQKRAFEKRQQAARRKKYEELKHEFE